MLHLHFEHPTMGRACSFNWLGRAILGIAVTFSGLPSALASLNPGSDEYGALIALYMATNGPSWTAPMVGNQWNDGGDACTWLGIVCDGDSHVITIDVAGFGLSGQLPPAADGPAGVKGLNHLTKLRGLNISDNSLTGEFPDLSGLPDMIFIEADRNKFTSIAAMARVGLRILSFNSNALKSFPDMSRMLFLQDLSLSNNQLTTFPALSPPGLQFLSVDHNQLRDFPSLASMPDLVGLDLSDNQLTAFPQDLSNEPELTSLIISNNQITGKIPAAPKSLMDAAVCPNPLDVTPQSSFDGAWDAATGVSPWWATPYATNACDELFHSDFGDL